MQGKFFKKAGSVLLASALLCGSGAFIMPQVTQVGIEVQAANTEKDFTFENEPYSDNKIIITGYNGSSSDVIIPAKLYGKIVDSIRSLGENNTKITSITIPNGCTEIESGAFANYTNLKRVSIPNSVMAIGGAYLGGAGAFENCTSLTSVTLPNKFDNWDSSSYGSKVYRFDYGQFKGCTALKTVTVPKGVKRICSVMFADCTSLTTVNLPDTLEYIQDTAFAGCTSLKSITIPSSVQVLDNNCFEGCKSLVSVNIPKNIDYFGSEVFRDCTSLKNVVFSGVPKSISNRLFYNCSSLSELIFPSGVEEIDYCSFGKCKNLKKIIIPESVKNISETAFEDEMDSKFSSPNLIIYGKKNSEANIYADKYDIPFKPLIATTGVVFNTSGIALNSKESYKIKATIKPNDATINTLTWKTSNANVATVSADGTVTAKNSGVATITATTADNKSAKCSVTVYGSPTSISLNSTQMSLGKGETTKLTATVGPQYAKDKTVKWRTSAPKVATVDQNGNVKSVGIGQVWITARTSNGLEKSCKITVKPAPTKVSLSNGILTIGVGEKRSLTASVNDGAGCATRTFRTSNPSVVKMTRTNWQGDFVGVKPGVAYVTVRTYNGKEATCKVTVKAAPTSVTISKKTLTMKVGQTASLSAWVNNNAGCATRTFRTSNPSVVKMTRTNWTGSFKAMKPGVAYVTVRTYNGKESSCKVTVTK